MGISIDFPNVLDQKELSLIDYLVKYKDYYQYQIDMLKNPSYTQIKERYLFSVFSVHRQFATTVRLFKKFRERDPIKIRLEELIDRRAGLYTQAIQGLKSWPLAYNVILAYQFRKHDIRGAMLRMVSGIGIAKTSFFLALCLPDENFICLDTWMLKFLELTTKDISTLSKYEGIEERYNKLASACSYRPFAFQWALWEYHQKKGTIDHSFLYQKRGEQRQ
jgi:hypothetical protein